MSYIMTTVFASASAFSHHFTLFAAMRFFTGVGISGIGIISSVLCEIYYIYYNPSLIYLVLSSVACEPCSSCKTKFVVVTSLIFHI